MMPKIDNSKLKIDGLSVSPEELKNIEKNIVTPFRDTKVKKAMAKAAKEREENEAKRR